MAFRFIHASDLHIGRKFANIPQPADGNIRGRLMEARHGSIVELAEAARSRGIEHVHNLRDAEPLWETIAGNAPENVIALTAPEPRDMGETATLLPCPVAFRAGASDPSEPLVTMASDEGKLRVGLAHGGVTDFTESGASIAPDRDRTARLDYLALGDWHGRMALSDRVQYSGSPEQDRFKHNRRGVCLCIGLDGPGAQPQVDEIEVGTFLWSEVELPLHPRQDAAAALNAILPDTGRRDVLLRVVATGWAGLPDHADLQRAADLCAPDFAHFDLLTGSLGTQYETADLDEIDRGGALRLAANRLMEDAEAESLSQQERQVAADALARLYSFVREASK